MATLKDAVYGFAVGDALGVPYEFKQRDTFKCTGMKGFGTWNQAAGTWSDDTSLLLATCDSIRELGKVDPEDMMERFKNWYRFGEYTARGEVFDVGHTTQHAINKFIQGCEPLKCGSSDFYSNGNGSLMRILPLAFVDGITPEQIKNVSKLTHSHRISCDCCVDFVNLCIDFINGNYNMTQFLNREDVKSSTYVIDTMNAVQWCIVNTDNYKDAVLTAVNLGGDTDTIAAITGGLAGIKYGYDSIPKEWIDALANKELIDKCLF